MNGSKFLQGLYVPENCTPFAAIERVRTAGQERPRQPVCRASTAGPTATPPMGLGVGCPVGRKGPCPVRSKLAGRGSLDSRVSEAWSAAPESIPPRLQSKALSQALHLRWSTCHGVTNSRDFPVYVGRPPNTSSRCQRQFGEPDDGMNPHVRSGSRLEGNSGAMPFPPKLPRPSSWQTVDAKLRSDSRSST